MVTMRFYSSSKQAKNLDWVQESQDQFHSEDKATSSHSKNKFQFTGEFENSEAVKPEKEEEVSGEGAGEAPAPEEPPVSGEVNEVTYEKEDRKIFELSDMKERFRDLDQASEGGGDRLYQRVLRGHDRIIGSAEDDELRGYGGDDRIRGGLGDDEIYGGRGKDKLHGGLGDDDLFGEAGNDRLMGEAGEDFLEGGKGKDRLYGGKEDDVLNGGDGKDDLLGGKGDDTLVGGLGKDKLFGGAGADTFEYNALEESMRRESDMILDFETGIDTLLISQSMAATVDELSFTEKGEMTFVRNLDTGFSLKVRGELAVTDIQFS